MRIDDLIKCCLSACQSAQHLDEQLRTYWGKPPEYIFTVEIAREIAEFFGDTVAVEVEKNVHELQSDASLAWGGTQSPRKKRQERIDICLSQDRDVDLDLYCIIEVKYAMWGLSDDTGKSDLTRICDLLKSETNELRYGLFVQYYPKQALLTDRKKPRDVVYDALKARKAAAREIVEGKKLNFSWKQSQIFTKRALVHLDESNERIDQGVVGKREVAWAFSVSRVSRPRYTKRFAS